MSKQILTRYGPLSPFLAAAVRRISEAVTHESVALLDSAHHTLTSSTEPFADSQDSPSTRWSALMVELFGTEQHALLVRQFSAHAGNDPALIAALAEDTDSRRATQGLFAAVGIFLVAEANTLRQRVDMGTLPEPAATQLDDIATQVTVNAHLLRAKVKSGAWTQLWDSAPVPRTSGSERHVDIGHEQKRSERPAHESAPHQRSFSALPLIVRDDPSGGTDDVPCGDPASTFTTAVGSSPQPVVISNERAGPGETHRLVAPSTTLPRRRFAFPIVAGFCVAFVVTVPMLLFSWSGSPAVTFSVMYPLVTILMALAHYLSRKSRLCAITRDSRRP